VLPSKSSTREDERLRFAGSSRGFAGDVARPDWRCGCRAVQAPLRKQAMMVAA
jgi:hypothetical protein